MRDAPKQASESNCLFVMTCKRWRCSWRALIFCRQWGHQMSSFLKPLKCQFTLLETNEKRHSHKEPILFMTQKTWKYLECNKVEEDLIGSFDQQSSWQQELESSSLKYPKNPENNDITIRNVEKLAVQKLFKNRWSKKVQNLYHLHDSRSLKVQFWSRKKAMVTIITTFYELVPSRRLRDDLTLPFMLAHISIVSLARVINEGYLPILKSFPFAVWSVAWDSNIFIAPPLKMEWMKYF